MSDLISRSKLLDIVENKYRDIVAGAYPFNIVAHDLAKIIKEQPAVEAVPVIHGEWIDNGEKDMNGVSKPFAISCSICGSSAGTSWMNFCPNCGADMTKKPVGKTDKLEGQE